MSLTQKIVRNLREIAVAARQGPDARRRVRRRYLFDALRYLVPYVAVDTADGFMVLATADRTISKSVFMAGQWAPEHFLRAVDIAERRTGSTVWEGRTVVDVGANIGTTTLLAARRAARVVAIEPAPDNFRLLRATVAANGLEGKVDTVQAAVSDEAGSAFLQLSAVNSGEHRVADSGGVPVRLVRLDDVLAELGVDDVGLLWIDVEGHEASVLAGAPELLRRPPPTVIEFLPGALGSTRDRLVALVEQAYSAVVDLRTGEDVTMAAVSETYRHSATDLLLLP